MLESVSLEPVTGVDVAPGMNVSSGTNIAPGKDAAPASRAESDGESLEEGWRKRLETAGNLLCRLCPDEVSTVRVVIPLSGQPNEPERLEALGRRLASERELTYQARSGSRSITITFSNRV